VAICPNLSRANATIEAALTTTPRWPDESA
jgi:hypothetical protein